MTQDDRLARIETHLDGMKDDLVEIKTEVKATNGRVRSLEAWKAWLTGAMMALGLLSPVASALLVAHLTG